MKIFTGFLVLANLALRVAAAPVNDTPFLVTINDTQHVIGNSIWNITIGQTYGTKLYYKGKDIIGNAVGHYVSYSMLLINAPCPFGSRS